MEIPKSFHGNQQKQKDKSVFGSMRKIIHRNNVNTELMRKKFLDFGVENGFIKIPLCKEKKIQPELKKISRVQPFPTPVQWELSIQRSLLAFKDNENMVTSVFKQFVSRTLNVFPDKEELDSLVKCISDFKKRDNNIELSKTQMDEHRALLDTKFIIIRAFLLNNNTGFYGKLDALNNMYKKIY
jgi:hypothetical protein